MIKSGTSNSKTLYKPIPIFLFIGLSANAVGTPEFFHNCPYGVSGKFSTFRMAFFATEKKHLRLFFFAFYYTTPKIEQ
jgi:hypothetical protein